MAAAAQPPSGGCVLKLIAQPLHAVDAKSAAFGRLCVETSYQPFKIAPRFVSRLRAAVC